ncbi:MULTISPECIES: putative holin-like toxin [Fructobacillus]|uniref:Holin-like toxin n=2 Tax=Fructobacillus TaxID=559173 RepID=A0ABN9YLX9_9LACO|nr:putative holin-like toxin [Fructobacillus cardui]NLS38092.1 putative holin-like toxin [Fructobacillus tropaeoli]CAK1221505.1 unnamed protein product [Fructobacillus sp. LMG 32999]MCK8627397.1 putative holin-like toxin [Fructobacillus cardui]CAK1221691.1 unnamed protein product [Fructobacillus sp. LMG 32999]CAK1225539.1 unnamed protein product [Fructobacillus sp. LMG 32999]
MSVVDVLTLLWAFGMFVLTLIGIVIDLVKLGQKK